MIARILYLLYADGLLGQFAVTTNATDGFVTLEKIARCLKDESIRFVLLENGKREVRASLVMYLEKKPDKEVIIYEVLATPE